MKILNTEMLEIWIQWYGMGKVRYENFTAVMCTKIFLGNQPH